MTTMDIGRATTHVAPERRSFGLLGLASRLLKRMTQRRRVRATLLAMAQMDPYMLRDIGIEPRDIYDALDGRKSSVLFSPIRKG